MEPKVIGQQENTQRYLIQVDDLRSQIFDKDRMIIWPPFWTDSIIARGYWEAFEDTDGSILAAAQEAVLQEE